MVIHVDNNGVQHNIKEIRRKSKILPDGLELYEYLESTGTQWINTGVICNSGISTYLDFQCTTSHSSYSEIMGYATSTSWTPYGFGTNTGTNGAFTKWGNGTITMSSVSFTTNRVNVTFLSNSTSNNGNIAIFTIGGNSGDYVNQYMKVFQCKITDSNNNLVRNMLPCKYYGEPGMWDSVNNKFYRNSGIGTFVLGPKINLEEYEYLQSTGTQYINTGIPYDSTKSTYKIECKFSQPSNVGQYDAIFGAYTGESYKCLRIIRGNSNSVMWTYYNNQANSGNKVAFSTANTNIREIVITSSSTILTENGTTTTYENKAVNGTNTTSTFYLFCQGIANDSPICLSKSIIYYFRLYDNDTLIKDFVPVSYNRTPGLWDKVEMKFYPNDGTGTFTLGHDYNYNKIHQIRKTKRLLPNGVELYDYIQSSGTQWIDTGIYGTLNTKVILEFKIPEANSSTTAGKYFGCRDGQNSKAFIIGTGNGTNTISTYFFTQFDSVSANILSNLNLDFNKHIIELSKDGFYIDNTLYRTFNSSGTFQTSHTLPIFGFYSIDTNQHTVATGILTVYSIKILENNQLVRNMVPCTYYGEPGMWDTVENKFYRNQGTGQFILGNKIVLKEYEYLESTGTQWIDTGVVINSYFKIQSKFQFVSTAGYQILYGMMPSSSTITPRISFWKYVNVWLTGINSSVQFGTYNNQVHTLEHTYNQQNGENIIMDGTNYVIQTNPSSISSNTLSLGLFSRHQNDTWSYPASAKIYFYKIYGSNGTTLLRNYVPCTCNEVPGLWDKVEWKFYGNSGTGQFNLGNINYYNIINLNITDQNT